MLYHNNILHRQSLHALSKKKINKSRGLARAVHLYIYTYIVHKSKCMSSVCPLCIPIYIYYLSEDHETLGSC